MFQYATTVNVPTKAQDRLAHITLTRFNRAAEWQATERVGASSLRTVLSECYEQFNGILSCRDQEIAAALGVNAYVNLSAMKVGVASSHLREALLPPDMLPWTIQPTPIPSLSDAGRMEALAMVKEQMFGQNFSGDLVALLRQIKATVLGKEEAVAKESAASMEKLMQDQCAEGGWASAMSALITDFCVYPFAVLHGPVPARVARMSWSGDTPRVKYETVYAFRSVSPWDFWYSPDSPDTQRGTGIFIRQRWTRSELLQAGSISSYSQANIEAIIREADDENYPKPYWWFTENPVQPDNAFSLWQQNSMTMDVLIHYGFFSGSELKEYGVSGLDDLQMYNACVTVIGERTIQVWVATNPTLNIRPVFTASFYKLQDRIPGCGIPQRLRDVERCYMSVLRYLMRNAANAAEPITEADFARLSKYMTREDLEMLAPGMTFLADSAMMGVNTPALRFYSVPAVTASYMQAMEYFMDLADRVTNIPAGLHGTAVGTGANRTFRGAAMLQGNAVKELQSAAANMDKTIFTPCGTLLYNQNMLYEKDDSIKGDAQVIAQGVQGALKREIDRQNAFEVLQLLGSAGNQVAGLVNPQLIGWALTNVLRTMDVPEEYLITAGQSAIPGPSGGALPGSPGGELPGPAASGGMTPVATPQLAEGGGM